MRRWLVVIAVAGCRSPPAENRTPERFDPKSLVELTLRADPDRLAPGGDTLVAAHFAVAEGWHIYWLNPGDAGLPTRALLRAPRGFTVSGPVFPAPERFMSPGNIISYGYEGEAGLLFQVTTAAAVEGPAVLAAEAEWLACREQCVRGKAAARLELPAGKATTAGSLARFAKRVPQPAGDLGLNIDWSGAGTDRVATVKVANASELDFFPYGNPVPRLRETSGSGSELRLVFRPRGTSQAVRGVLEVVEEGATRWYEVEWPWPG